MDTNPQKLRYGIIGAGRLATSLALVMLPHLDWIISRRSERRQILARDLGTSVRILASTDDIDILPDCVMVVVADTAIEDIAQQLAPLLLEHGQQVFVMHCSGALTLDALAACRQTGARVLAAHPYQTFAHPHPRAFERIAWGIECRPAERGFAEAFVRWLGGIPVFLAPETLRTKALYHASAAVAANYLMMVVGLARDMAYQAGIEPEKFLPPIMRSALEHGLAALSRDSEHFPLTGPIARSDVATLRIHAESLRGEPNLLRMYTMLAETTADLAQKYGLITEEKRNLIVEEFKREH